jgi:hypothetical protein
LEIYVGEKMRLLALWLTAAIFFAFVGLPTSAATWTKGESEHFTVYSHDGASNTVECTTQLEKLNQVLTSEFNVATHTLDTQSRFEVYFLENFSDLRDIKPDISKEARGLVTTGKEGVQGFVLNHQESPSRLPFKGRSESLTQITAFHEYTGLFLRSLPSQHYPTWFLDGASEYYSTTHIDLSDAIIGLPGSSRVAILEKANHWIPYRDILTAKANYIADDLYYAQVWLLTHFILSTPQNRERLQIYLSLVENGEERDSAFEEAFDVNMDQLASRLSAYLKQELPSKTVTFSDPSPAAVQLETFPTSDNKMVLWRAALIAGSNDDDLPQLLEYIRTESRDNPPDDLTTLTEVRAAMQLVANLDEAGEKIDLYARTHPEDAEGQYLLGRVEYFQAVRQWDTPVGREHSARALEAFNKSFLLAPRYAPNLFFWSLAQYPEPKMTETNLLAVKLAPSVDRYAWTAIYRLIADNRFDDAAGILRTAVASGKAPRRQLEAAKLLAGIKAGATKEELAKISTGVTNK